MIVASKKKPYFYKNTKHLEDAEKLLNSKLNFSEDSQDITSEYPEDELYDTINRLSDNITNHITAPVILSDLQSFLNRQKSNIIQSALVLGGVFMLGNLLQLSFSSPFLIVNFALKLVYFATTLGVGVYILRSILLTQAEQEECDYYYGLTPFVGLHLVLVMTGLIAILFVEYAYAYFGLNAIDYQYSYFFCSIALISAITSLLLTRIGFLIPAMIYPNNDTLLDNFVNRTKPFLKPLFSFLFSAKLLCLSIMVFSDSLSVYFDNAFLMQFITLCIKTAGFIAYHIFTYALLGVSFKLYCQMKVKT